MNKKRIKDIIIRAAKTFIQAFLGAISVDVLFATSDRNVWRSMFLGALAAGFSALMNYIINRLDVKRSEYNAVQTTDHKT